MEITDSRKFQSKKIIYSETGEHVLPPFFGKIGQNEQRESADENRVQSTNWKKGRTFNAIRRWSEEFNPDKWASGSESTNRHEEGSIRRSTPKGKHGGGGSIHDWQRVESQFLDSCKCPFIFLVSFAFRCQ
jgi:hypothetical protein